MPSLDPTGEAIVLAYLENGGNQSAAWLTGHPNSKAQPQTVHVQASKFFSQDKVRIRIVELQSKVEAAAVEGLALTLDAHMEKLAQLRDKAEENGQLSAAIAAEVKRGELRRFYVKQVDVQADHKHTHVTEPVSKTAEWLEGVLGRGSDRAGKKSLPN